jgi:hypothetical protein
MGVTDALGPGPDRWLKNSIFGVDHGGRTL